VNEVGERIDDVAANEGDLLVVDPVDVDIIVEVDPVVVDFIVISVELIGKLVIVVFRMAVDELLIKIGILLV